MGPNIVSLLAIAYILTHFSIYAANGDVKTRKFPPNFKFGASTSSYQIEGGWNASDKGVSIWDRLVHDTKLVIDGTTGDIACDSYNQYKKDIDMLADIGVDFYRFSISWPRLMPTGFASQISWSGLAYYNALIDELLAKGVAPTITMYHWDLPQQLQQLGGWTNPRMVGYFVDYARVVFGAFGHKVRTWITFNEPTIMCAMGYGSDGMAPAMNMSGVGDYLCGHTVLLAHAEVYRMYDKEFRSKQGGKVGLTLHTPWLEPTDDSQESKIAMDFELGWFANPIFTPHGDYPIPMKEAIAAKSINQGYPTSRLPAFTQSEIELIRGTYDFFGLNHYTTKLVKKTPNDTVFVIPSYQDDRGVIHYQDEKWPRSASTWLKVVPWGFTKLLDWIRVKYDNPEVIIFENGYSDTENDLSDDNRIEYYSLYLNAMLDAMAKGSNVTGYSVWSLMDNFEWLAGYTERFGLYHVDFESPNRTRTPKESALFYRDIIKDRSIETYSSESDINYYIKSEEFFQE